MRKVSDFLARAGVNLDTTEAVLFNGVASAAFTILSPELARTGILRIARGLERAGVGPLCSTRAGRLLRQGTRREASRLGAL